MAKGFTPMIGLAVVVALALAAVFGAMSLTNPAFAAVGAPADAELTERTFSPQVSSLKAVGGDGRVTLTWNTQYVAAEGGNDAMGVQQGEWEVRWRLGDEAYSVDDWHKSTGLTLTAADRDIDPSAGANLRGVQRNMSFGAKLMPDVEVDGQTETNTRYTMTAVVGLVAADLAAFTGGDGNLRNFAEYQFQVRDGTAPDDQTRVWPISRTPAAPPDEVDDLDAEPGIREVVLEWDKAPSDNYVSAWQVLYYSEEEAELSGVTDAAIHAETGDVVVPGVEYVAPVTAAPDADPPVVAVTEVDFVPEISWMTISNSDEDTDGYTIDELDSGTMYTFWVRAVSFDTTGMVDEDDESYEVVDAEDMKPAAPMDLEISNMTAEGAEDDEGLVSVSWENPDDPGITMWQYSYMKDKDDKDVWNNIDDPAMVSASITGLMLGVEYTVKVRAVAGPATGEYSMEVTTPIAPVPFVFDPSFTADSKDPGSNTRYDLKVQVDGEMNTLTDELVIKLEDFGFPDSGTIGVNSIAINVDEDEQGRTTIPEDVAVSGDKIFITIGDLNKDRTGGDQTAGGETADFDIADDGIIHVVIRQSAGVSNPTASGDYGPVVTVKQIISGDKLVDEDFDGVDLLTVTVPRILGIDPEDGGLGEEITVTGEGFRKGTSLLVFVDKPVHMDDDNDASTPMSDDDGVVGEDTKMPNRILDPAEDVVCRVAKIDGDSVGVCTFSISHPSFAPDVNFLNAVDGRDMYVSATEDLPEFLLEQSISASPNSGNPGQVILVQLVDFDPGTAITKVELSRTAECSASCGVTNSSGSGTYNLVIPNWAKGGIQELRVTVGTGANAKNSSTNVTIGGPRLTSTPETVVANQRISLVGTGFSPNSKIGDDEGDSIMSIGGDPIPWGKINDNDDVVVDSGGNWSASVDLPLTETTTGSGTLSIRVRDSGNRSGIVKVSIQERSFEIIPESGRVGTLALVKGEGYPGKNDEGKSFSVVIEYQVNDESKTTVSVIPDAGGNFEAQIRIPTSAAIPSTNPVQVSFEREGAGPVVETEQHMVPEGEVVLTPTSGGPGSMVSLHGEGFKSFVPVKSVKIGSIEVTPSPRPSTDINGMMDFDVLIPGLDVGIQTIEVQVGSTTASRGFTITESGINPGNIVEIGAGLEDLGDNFVNIWHFNNDTKAWSFYDGMEGSDLTHLITGETYLIQVKSTMEVILNRDTRNLTCVGGNCWNQVVW